MSRATEIKNLIAVKNALADKCERLARDRSSKPAKARLLRHSLTYRREAERIAKAANL